MWRMLPHQVYHALIHATLVSAFHIPDLSVRSDVSLDSNIINSTLRQNWSQSLNIGSVSIVATLVILFVCLFMYVRLQSQLDQQQRCLTDLKDEFQQLKSQKAIRTKGRSFSTV